MDNQALRDKVLSIVPDAEFEETPQYLSVFVPAEKIHQLCIQLKNDKDTSFDFLNCVSGVDNVEYLMVVYHLSSTTHKHKITLKVKTFDRQDPKVDTVCDIWKTAEFHEREVYDFFGIRFNNHPDMRRIFLTEDFQGYPLRKDYVIEGNTDSK